MRIFGGDEEDRTLDHTDANRTLSQLSYAPEYTVLTDCRCTDRCENTAPTDILRSRSGTRRYVSTVRVLFRTNAIVSHIIKKINSNFTDF